MSGEYISRAAAIEYIKANQCQKCSDIGLCGKCAVLTAIKLFEAIPAADVVEVVRCRDCKHRLDNDFCSGRGWPMGQVPDDGYCDHGKRKDGGRGE